MRRIGRSRVLTALVFAILTTACASAPGPVSEGPGAPGGEDREPAPAPAETPAGSPPRPDIEELPDVEPSQEEGGPVGGYEVVQVLYVTDRNDTGSDRPVERFGVERGTVRYGRCVVSIPEGHRRDRIEGPAWWRLQFSTRPDQHVVLLALAEIQPRQFFDTLRGSSADALVFVHGFDVTFEDAVRQTAQLAYDLEFPGIPIAYSWPSEGEGTPQGYRNDEASVAWTVRHLEAVLRDLRAASPDRKLHLLAHSMGSRALTKALAEIARRSPASRFSQVVLAAPDIDAATFERDVAPYIRKAARRVTLYASSVDDSLMFSKTIDDRQRAGEGGAGLIVCPGIDTIDISRVATSLVGDAHFAAPEALIRDLAAVVNQGFAPDARNLMRRKRRSQDYWILRP